MPISYFDIFIENALKEDIGDGDHTSRACIPDDAIGKAQLLIKEKGILPVLILPQESSADLIRL
jgi:nicotinate-nucleotide pyrophosphorylase (carboxylating)